MTHALELQLECSSEAIRLVKRRPTSRAHLIGQLSRGTAETYKYQQINVWWVMAGG